MKNVLFSELAILVYFSLSLCNTYLNKHTNAHTNALSNYALSSSICLSPFLSNSLACKAKYFASTQRIQQKL